MLIGIDLGGTKIEIAALDANGQQAYRNRRKAPSQNYEATLEAIRDLVAEAEDAVGEVCSVGIGTPGATARKTGLIKNAYATALNGKPFKADIETALDREVRVANDANCFALSEAMDGGGKGADVMFGVILGTGVGGGVVVGRRVLEGVNAIAGEWGHNALPWPDDSEAQGFSYYEGGEHDIEAFLSGGGLVHDHRRATGEELEAPEIGKADTPAKRASMEHYERRLAKALASVINILDPEVIVLGGGLSNIARLYETVPKLWGEWVFSDTVETKLVKNAHGDSSGVRGAAWLWADL